MKQKNPPVKRLSREEKKRETRRSILHSAQELFAQKGFEGTPIEEIAETAGYSRGAFYSNFKNKEQVMEELIKEGFDSDIEQLKEFKKLTEPDELARAFEKIGLLFSEHPEHLLWMLEFQLSVVRHPELKRSYTNEHSKLRETIAELIEVSMKRQNHPNPPSTRKYTDLFLVTLTGMSMYKLLYEDELPDSIFSDFFITILKGIQK